MYIENTTALIDRMATIKNLIFLIINTLRPLHTQLSLVSDL